MILRARSSAPSAAAPDIDAGLFDFARDILTLKAKGKNEAEFVARFQQFTPTGDGQGSGGHGVLLLQNRLGGAVRGSAAIQAWRG